MNSIAPQRALRALVALVLALGIIACLEVPAGAADAGPTYYINTPPTLCASTFARVHFPKVSEVDGLAATGVFHNSGCVNNDNLTSGYIRVQAIYWDVPYPSAHVCGYSPSAFTFIYNPAPSQNESDAYGAWYPCSYGYGAAVSSNSGVFLYPGFWSSGSIITSFVSLGQ